MDRENAGFRTHLFALLGLTRTISRHGHSVVWQKEWYQVFRFAEEEHADRFMQEYGGERMHPSERGKGKNWAQWKKGTYTPKLRSPLRLPILSRTMWEQRG